MIDVKKSSSFAIAILTVFGVVFGIFANSSPSFAQTKAYEFTGSWTNQPDSAVSGKTVIGALWRFDVNDDKPAPANDPVNGNILTASLENARFAKLPSTCLTAATAPAGITLNPVSAISADGKTLTCNIGPRVQGTAELALTSIIADGPSGSDITAKAEFRGLAAELPKILVKNPFGMDAQFNLGSPTSVIGDPLSEQWVTFPFSLRHATFSPAGPDSVTYDINVTSDIRQDVLLRQPSCSAISDVNPGYPFSDDSHEKEQSTSFPSCELNLVSPNKFQLVLSGLKYDGQHPSLDSNGQPLPSGMDVIAAGELQFKTNFAPGGGPDTVKLSASAPVYTATDGQTSSDDPSNNTNAAPMTRGFFTGGWGLAAQRPESYPGSLWTDTSRAPVGATVMSLAGMAPPTSALQQSSNWMCQVLETDHVTFQAARASLSYSAYDNNFPGKIWYYTGEFVDPVSGKPVDPNEFACGTRTDPNDPAFGNPVGWSTTLPADLSQVKAVKIEITKQQASLVNNVAGDVLMVVDQKIKPDTALGTDIWTWTSWLASGSDDWAWSPTSLKVFGHSRDVADKRSYETATPDLRYPFAGPGRDVLRVVGSEPKVAASVAQNVYGPGSEVDYTIKYGLQTVMANPAPDTVVVKDTLPATMTYVPNSAPIEPETTQDKNGNQVLTWTFDNVQPNADLSVINFKAKMPDEAAPGSKHVNRVTATSQTIVRSDSVEVIVPDSGYTTLAQQSQNASVDLVDGNAKNAWTITLTSQNPTLTNLTDVIDILPYNGDERGTKFTGTLQLTGTKVPQNAVIYYTTADPKTLSEDPDAKSNGATGEPSQLWTTTFTANATAIRVVNKQPLTLNEKQETIINVQVDGASHNDVYVNLATGRTDSTKLRMRTSAQFGVKDPNFTPPNPPASNQPPVNPPAPNPPVPNQPAPLQPQNPAPAAEQTPAPKTTKPGLPNTGANGNGLATLSLGLLILTGAAVAVRRTRH